MLPPSRRPKQWCAIEVPVIPLARNLCGHPSAGLLWERRLEDVREKTGDKVRSWECQNDHRTKELFLSVFEDDIKMVGKQEHVGLMWGSLRKDIEQKDPASG